MSVQDTYYGKATYSADHVININIKKPFHNREIFPMKTYAVNVGKNPVVSTSVYSFVVKDIDERWLTTGITNFEPYSATQISSNQIVLTMPICSYDQLFGPKPDDEGNYEQSAMKDVFLLGDEGSQDQTEFEVQRNKLDETKPETFTVGWLLQFDKGEKLDYTLIDKDHRDGYIKWQIVGGPSVGLMWKIAVVPEEDRTFTMKSPLRNQAAAKLAAFKAKRQALNEVRDGMY